MSATTGREHKIVICGPMGVGKTTAIAAVSERPPILTEVRNLDTGSHAKASTTVAMDYGEVTLDGGDRLRLYGTPGQDRFDFMWRVVARDALGIVVLADNSRADPLADTRRYLDVFADAIGKSCGVIGVTRGSEHPNPGVADYAALAAEFELALPVFSVDPRSRRDVLLLLDILFHQIEAMDPPGPGRSVRP
jgi:hypothetical protein